jgi:hypothetical protein
VDWGFKNIEPHSRCATIVEYCLALVLGTTILALIIAAAFAAVTLFS